LVYSIEEREGWALVAGQPGSGKTTLLVALIKQLGDQVWPAVVTDPNLSQADFFNLLSLELGFEKPMSSKAEFLLALRGLITLCRKRGKALLIVIDDAQAMPKALLRELILLSRQDTGKPRVLNIFLLGTAELLYRLKDPPMRPLAQSIRRRCLLKALPTSEAVRYIVHRLKAAGGSENIFTPEARYAIAEAAEGNPRQINSLCDAALLKAFSRDQRTVNLALAQEIISGEDLAPEAAEDKTAELASPPDPEPPEAPDPVVPVADELEAEPPPASDQEDQGEEASTDRAAPCQPEPAETAPSERQSAAAAAVAEVAARQARRGQGGGVLRRVAAMVLLVVLLGGGYLLANIYGPTVIGLSTEKRPRIYIPPAPTSGQGKGPAITSSSQTGN
jgi:general secretion pathway protein A